MAKSLLLEVVTPDRLVIGQDVASVTAAGTAGAFTVLPQHIPFLTSLAVGYLSFRVDGVVHTVFVSGGFADVTFDKVLILAEAAELPDEIDVDRAKRARERAEARLTLERREHIDYVRARSALERAVMRIRLHELGISGLGLHPGA
ncbi:MAG: F0F1 ATP synthase subunit epsilon [Desulfovibrio sp.]